MLAVLGVSLGLLHINFGLTNFQPGFPKIEGVAAMTAGLALLVSLALARRSVHRALLTAFFGTLPLVAWFAYAVPVEGSSDPIFFWVSLVLPTATGVSLLILPRSGLQPPHRAS